MSLPLPGAPWPPAPHDVALAQQNIWNAWYVGDPEGLASVYSGYTTAGLRMSSNEASFDRWTTRQGGVIPALARFFWGRPNTTGQKRSRLHVPLASDIATASADLLFSEPPQFSLADGKPKAMARVDEVLNQGDFHATLLEAGELAAALGGAYLRLVWDKDIADHVIIDAVDADSALAEWQWGQLRAVTFFTEDIQGTGPQAKVYRWLERHEPGVILHGLYLGTAKELGRLMALDEHPMTEGLAGQVGLDGSIPTKVKGLTAAYAPNVRPQRKWRKVPELANLGRSDFGGVEALMDSLDETMTAWAQAIRLGRARLIVPEDYLKDLGKGQGAAFDYDQEIFTPVKMMAATPDASMIKPQQFEIDVDSHKKTCDQLIDQILDAAGYSPSTFGRGGEGDKTATEVVSRERKSARTRDKKSRYWALALEPFLTTWLALDAVVFGGGATGAIEATFPDEAQPGQETLARTAGLMRTAEAGSTDTLVRMMHSDWDETQIADEVARILAEAGRSVPDLGPLGGVVVESGESLLDDIEGGGINEVDDLTQRVDAAAVLIRSGFEPQAALDAVGLDRIKHLHLLPVTVKSPKAPA